VTWLAPDWIAVGFGPLNWPNAQEFLDPGNIRTFGYTGALVLYSTFTFIPKAGAKPGPFVPVQANVEWLACKDICLPGRAELKLTLPVDSKPPVFTPHAQLFEHTN
ncbi:MAG: hypothetical protein HYT88_07435, partial [Candidatus Omnitrophica bacterium]|nr:hypothetical protein [Candidatus Omnitrophota bacterium]